MHQALTYVQLFTSYDKPLHLKAKTEEAVDHDICPLAELAGLRRQLLRLDEADAVRLALLDQAVEQWLVCALWVAHLR